MTALAGENPTEFIARVRTAIVGLLDEHSARILDPKNSKGAKK